MTTVEWAMWANEQAFISSAVIVLGGILAVAGAFARWYIGVVSIILGVLIMFVEYPRSKRPKGATVQRVFQSYIAPVVAKLGIVSSSYYSRFVIYMLFSIPCFFILSTLLGGVSLIVSSLLYFVAAYKGEHWAPPVTTTKPKGRAQEPTHPPPRLPPTNQKADDSTRHIYANEVVTANVI